MPYKLIFCPTTPPSAKHHHLFAKTPIESFSTGKTFSLWKKEVDWKVLFGILMCLLVSLRSSLRKQRREAGTCSQPAYKKVMILNAPSKWLLMHHQNNFQRSIRTIGLEWSTYMCGWTLPPSGYLVPADTMPLLTPFTTPITPVTHTLTPYKHTRIQKPKSQTLKYKRNERVHFLGYTHIYICTF